MLSGNIPYLVSSEHPDEFLAARLGYNLGESLVRQDLRHLADGLEGRSTNPVSLLLDSLLHPCADIGLEMEPLVEFRKSGKPVRSNNKFVVLLLRLSYFQPLTIKTCLVLLVFNKCNLHIIHIFPFIFIYIYL